MLNDKEVQIVNGISVDIKKAEKILAWLIRKEAENVRTKALSDVRMIAEIQDRIKEEKQCY
ncbi:hypothetical protein [Saccharibacillus endophyticus]|uniref:Uncharacterized protein n=1 Tax=Saccharibacillus endophyticus TaxID=2060666 RepID=A0ABQ1ZUM2_9BACL|nr:hypothetical protein [Saccharibacillus endophyticus]GGH76766.1 hypothetical protein GCM10007362_19510 [Saccharibacillus endophyticus]